MNSFKKVLSFQRSTVTFCVYFLLVLDSATCNSEDEENLLAVRQHGGYLSFPDALSEYTDPKFQSNDNVQGLLRIYRTNCPMYFGKSQDRKLTSRHIFVAVEGTHRITRNIVSNKLAERLGANHMYSPPAFMTRTKLVHNDTNGMKRAFFMLGIYATAHIVRDAVSELPIVTAGYFVDQIAFSIASAFEHELPNRESVLYKWPKDLLKPDILFFINTPSQLTKKTIDLLSFRGRIVQIYRNWEQPPPVVEVNNTNLYDGMVDLMMKIIKTKLNYEGSPIPVAEDDDINCCFFTNNR
uniref:Receptor ligand binding region domain-containing protein n=1 Tax=Graphocephala atropunctata TaxID=36148 RepID=A0A1B6MFV5_9HEMI